MRKFSRKGWERNWKPLNFFFSPFFNCLDLDINQSLKSSPLLTTRNPQNPSPLLVNLFLMFLWLVCTRGKFFVTFWWLSLPNKITFRGEEQRCTMSSRQHHIQLYLESFKCYDQQWPKKKALVCHPWQLEISAGVLAMRSSSQTLKHWSNEATPSF